MTQLSRVVQAVLTSTNALQALDDDLEAETPADAVLEQSVPSTSVSTDQLTTSVEPHHLPTEDVLLLHTHTRTRTHGHCRQHKSIVIRPWLQRRQYTFCNTDNILRDAEMTTVTDGRIRDLYIVMVSTMLV